MPLDVVDGSDRITALYAYRLFGSPAAVWVPRLLYEQLVLELLFVKLPIALQARSRWSGQLSPFPPNAVSPMRVVERL